MARWDKYWRDEAYVSRNWLDPTPTWSVSTSS